MQRQREEEDNNTGSGLGWLVGILGGVAIGGALVVGDMIYEEEKKENERIQALNRRRGNRIRQSNPHIDNEYDNVARNAKVYLCTSPLDQLPVAIEPKYHHWEILVEFEDGSYRTLDGFGGDDGRMHGRYRKVQPATYLKKINLGSKTISPQKLFEYVSKNVLNNTLYNTSANNCQNWTLEVAKDLGIDIFRQLLKIDRLGGGITYVVGMCSALGAAFAKSSNGRM